MSKQKHIRFDWAIKRLLRHKANFTILEGFLSELLNFDVKIEEILESESNREHAKDKSNKVDILVKDTQNSYMLIEVQNQSQDDYYQRMLYGQAKLIVERLDIGDKYGKLTRFYSINVVYFPLGTGEDYIYKSDGNFKGIHYGDVLQLTEKQKHHYNVKQVKDLFTQYYIIKVNNFDDIAKNTLDEWIYFLKNSEIKDEFRAKGLKEAKERLRVDNLSVSEKQAYDDFVKSERIKNSEIDTAFSDGQYEKQKELEQKQRELDAEREEKEQKQKELEQKQKELDTERQEKELKQKELDTERQNADKLKLKMILKLQKLGMSNNEIADDLEISVPEIQKLLQS